MDEVQRLPEQPLSVPSGRWGGALCTYELFEDALIGGRSQNEAEEVCVSNGGHLASIHDVTTLSQIGSLVEAAGLRSVWIGLHDQHLESGCEETGFIWTDGTPTDYENWADGEPNDWQSGSGANCGDDDSADTDADADAEGGEDCVEQYGDGYQWNDQSCDEERAYVCSRGC